MYFTEKTFWKGLCERAVKTFAQTLAASLTAGVAITAIDWRGALAIAATATILSVLTSLADPTRADTGIATGDSESGEIDEMLEREILNPVPNPVAPIVHGKHALEDAE